MNDTAQIVAPKVRRAPIFTSIAGAMIVVCMTTPFIMLSTPATITVAAAIVALFRKERFWWAALIALVAAVFMMFAASAHFRAGPFKSTTTDLSKAQIGSWDWEVKSLGSRDTIKWRVEVKNLSDRPMEAVKVDFGTFDSAGKLISDTSTFVTAIPPGQSRASEGYADSYGTEANAKVKIGSIRYAGL